MSIFDDGIEGFAHIKITREPDPEEKNFLIQKYSFLNEEQMNDRYEWGVFPLKPDLLPDLGSVRL